MEFCWSTLRVKDMEQSLKFYQEIVGLNLVSKFNAENGIEIAFLGKRRTKIELICNGNSNINIGKDISWGFKTKSLQQKLDYVVSKGITADGPYSPNANTSFFFITDPNGMKIQFVETK
ncbi:MAG: VOC family protein [Clostridiales bacterium]|nr:VOC family protein [Clostridiales bacterium]